MTNLKNDSINMRIPSSSVAEDYCLKKIALTECIIAALGNAKEQTLEECLLLMKHLELQPDQINLITNSINSN